MTRVRLLVVMGVSGAGKTTLGKTLAKDLNWLFADADDFHPPANVMKMAAGRPLDDADREPWLQTLRQYCADVMAPPTPENPAAAPAEGTVLACSALKRAYRETLGLDHPGAGLIFLDGPRWVLQQRLQGRANHFMPASLLDSQLKTLERPEAEALRLDFRESPEVLVETVKQHFSLP
ncbi:MAG: gluconokinase [Acidobacteriota bacterium]